VAGSRTARRWALAGLLVVAGLVSSGCSWADLPRFGWPQSASKQGAQMQYFWSAAFIAALAVGVVVWGLMFWCFIVYRKRKNSPLYPKQTRENLPVEIVYTAVPFVLIAVLFYFTVSTENQVLKLDPNPDVTVDVTAFKWNWDFGYQGTTVQGTDQEVHTIGTSEEIPVLILPNTKTIEYVLESRDVVHSFWVPAFDFKRDVFPDPGKNNTENRFQTTLERTGAWVGRCAELCGTYHSAMNFEVRSVPEDIYTDYIAAREQGMTNSQALTKVGKDHPECGALCSPTATTTYPLDTDRQAGTAPKPPANVTGLK
jgi:cytochrome c oxidase subunit 2